MATLTATSLRVLVKRSEFLKALKPVVEVARKMATLNYAVKVEASDTGLITLTGVNDTMTIRRFVPAEVLFPGEFVAEGRDLLLFTQYALSEDMTVTNLNSNQLTVDIEAGDDRFTVGCIRPDAIGAQPTDFEPFATIGKASLHELVSALTPVTAKDDHKPWLTCICLRSGANLTACSTDGTRLGAWNYKNEPWAGEAIIETPVLKRAVEFAAPGETIRIEKGKHMVKLSGHDFEVYGRLMQGSEKDGGKYPDLMRLVPKAYPPNVTMDRQTLLNTVRLAVRVRKEQEVVLTITGGAAQVHFKTGTGSSMVRKLSATIDGPMPEDGTFRIGFKANVLLGPLQQLGGTDVRFGFSGGRNPARLVSDTSPNLTYVVLPLITY